MTQADIIKMARQAGGREMVSALTHPNGPTTSVKFHLESGTLEAFAKLVAAKEREACANLCEDQAQEYYSDGSKRAMNYQCADAIRARGEA